MKYVYCYQTKDNENRRGQIDARDRAEAYLLLRKQGIRPYRVIGDDPVRWQPWAILAGFVVLFAVSAVSLTLLLSRPAADPADALVRRQVKGDRTLLVKGFASGWTGIFDSGLDRLLAMYAQPGWNVVQGDFTEEEIAAFMQDMSGKVGLLVKGVPEYDELASIVAAMREELSASLSGGGSMEDYLRMLESRQELECSLRAKAHSSLVNTAPTLRKTMLKNINKRLASMGIEELGQGSEEEGE